MARERLTKTQRVILGAAVQHEHGFVRLGPPDRKGARVIGRDATGIPVVIAYGAVEISLDARGLLRPHGSEPYVYVITNKGADAVAPPEREMGIWPRRRRATNTVVRP